ncbi:hypothetical protein B296_00047526 [Ensete ventricosum]|uniref:Uncharacterized protein n=1 Tax=Ensete ventricosum TaxID=4639 RepID=A0A426YZ34_ENSVE|nr:hypothetical protein B296_00047526 [Ensete ventricosum]
MLGNRVLHLAERSCSSSSSSSSVVDEMEVRCRECRKREQHYYWNHFEATKKRFFKVLIADFSRELVSCLCFGLTSNRVAQSDDDDMLITRHFFLAEHPEEVCAALQGLTGGC